MSEETAAAVEEAPAVTPEVEAPATTEAPPTPAAVEHPESENVSPKTKQRRIMQARVKAADASRERALEQPREDAGKPEGGELRLPNVRAGQEWSNRGNVRKGPSCG